MIIKQFSVKQSSSSILQATIHYSLLEVQFFITLQITTSSSGSNIYKNYNNSDFDYETQTVKVLRNML